MQQTTETSDNILLITTSPNISQWVVKHNSVYSTNNLN